ncbi:VOC family protein [Nesterenkonia halotolerans]|uniref:Catechol 2,3-dioxygenase-like lactoylglutathione lyase family enzyme n=1 Tax=Nesterenkonia halotolerans TaxID=225325 RepID=A0ABR9JA70_9MICC|nr:VOC family protein [Nesterenkonia halotolerans]MBE1515900.1 catechol 2,3-dioxygenase-like lactoylglutathione lyase family enzyme [Nesterenkonia halotolerans]
MKLQTISIFVDDQQHALDFYTHTLGFTVTADVPIGEHRWLTVVDPDRPDATEISLEPKSHPAAVAFTAALAADGIPMCVLGVENVQEVHDRLSAQGVTFTQPPTEMGPVTIAVFDDTCGNFLQIAQYNG